jgi:lipoprotein-anchoring transpeptidase ErfK/SrfK
VSTGTPQHATPTGTFRVTEKDEDHRSSRYGDYVDAQGNVVVKDVDNRKDPKPAGATYLGADMAYFLRFNRGIGMHRGFLPGYPASHGCVRLPEHMAMKFYENADYGTPVKVVP